MQRTHPAIWTQGDHALWDRVARHDFGSGQPLGFSRRMARDKGWTAGFTQAAIGEYRRFCFLAVVSSAPVTPSEEVDEVWHMHLTYTRDYWDVWCAQVLGRPLHHDPTRGGPAEQAKFHAQYAATLALYENYFGPPDAAFWPATHLRIAAMPRFRSYDATRWLLLPRPARLWRRIRRAEQPDAPR